MNTWIPLPAEACALVEHTPATVLLENSRHSAAEPISRLFVSPQRVLVVHDTAEIPHLFEQIESAVASGHFAAGYFAYECAHAFEPAVAQRPESSRQPLAWFGIYDRCHRFDHTRGAFLDGDPPDLGRFQIGESARNESIPPLHLAPVFNREQYSARIDAIHEWIRAGDVYQLNLTFPLRGENDTQPADLYLQLRSRQPVEYGAFLHTAPGNYHLSFSPELFFQIQQSGVTRRITARPMKGTARRGRTNAEDLILAERLRNDTKNRSENVMIVDLIRNDLGRLCEFGSVQVENLFAVERYPTLWQMTSTVTGNLRRDVGFRDTFRALFPCGSVTGAPKVRAMQLLAQLEEQPREVYTGAIGFFSRERTVFNVAIRTLELNGQSAKMGVGSGIVIDSSAADEYRECLLKAEFLLNATEPFSLVETLLWQGDFPFIELHLARLEDSADYFGFACDRAAIRAALITLSRSFGDQQPRKVRLLLDANGIFHLEHEALPAALPSHNAPPVRVCVATKRTDPADRFLYHKTTHRPLYANAFKSASDAGFADVLFLNREDQVTEGAISNLFIEKAARWFTPPVECGLLPGVYRRHLLATRPEISERILTLHDLETADAIYLANAVRGLRRVTINREK
jgi:para-aminobenzoate synthetase/4-amino-4-deoxychorismate lyase